MFNQIKNPSLKNPFLYAIFIVNYRHWCVFLVGHAAFDPMRTIITIGYIAVSPVNIQIGKALLALNFNHNNDKDW
ncbi:MAG: hypothetical protein DRR19_09385 [Candidatus Parabeggiatoa sp. nov. 1]|nr:MAG: hypothetical protein DRR19_09385 [Gammaproteobacteria bacterium]